MDYSFYLQQGQELLNEDKASSIKKAVEYFRKANQMIGHDNIGKPRTLYHLALGNYMIGQIEHSYKIAHKAKKSLDIAIENSMISMNNMRQLLGEDEITALIDHITAKFPQIALVTDIDKEDFDENTLDFSLLNQMYEDHIQHHLEPDFTMENLSNELLLATFFGLSREDDELIYFDKLAVHQM